MNNERHLVEIAQDFELSEKEEEKDVRYNYEEFSAYIHSSQTCPAISRCLISVDFQSDKKSYKFLCVITPQDKNTLTKLETEANKTAKKFKGQATKEVVSRPDSIGPFKKPFRLSYIIFTISW